MDDIQRPEDDDLAALDFFAPDHVSGASDLDVLSGYEPNGPDATDEHVDTRAPEPTALLDSDRWGDDNWPDDWPEDGPADPVFVVTNPPGTVTVSTFIDGRVHHIDLSPKVRTLTERHLAEEIVVIARLAAQEARAAQYAVMLDGLREQGHDDSATRDFLSRDLELPSPEDATAARAQVFATRYAGEE